MPKRCTTTSTSHACPACGGRVDCGMANGEATCWCFELPHALPVAGAEARCYCRDCLENLIAEAVAEQAGTATPPGTGPVEAARRTRAR